MKNPQSKAKLDEALATYPIYQPTKLYNLIPTREQLNQKLLNHYKYREIGFETVGRFLDELEITMCEIMPRYNELFKTVETMAELPSPFDNVDFTETYTETRTGSSSVNNSGSNTGSVVTDSTSSREATEAQISSGDGKNTITTTPGNEISIPAKSIDSVTYADSVNWNSDNSESSTSTESSDTAKVESTNTNSSTSETIGTSTDTVEHTFKKVGNQGVNTYAHDMLEYREAIVDYVEQIINDERIQDLFMLVY